MRAKETRADRLWTETIHKLFNGRCVICREENEETKRKDEMHAHHLIGRRHKRARWSLLNGVLLCSEHHRALHDGHPPTKEKLDAVLSKTLPFHKEYVEQFHQDRFKGSLSPNEFDEAIRILKSV